MASFQAATNLAHPAIKIYTGPQPSTTRGAGIHIGKHPKLPKIIYPSGKYIVVRDLTNPNDFFVYRGHNTTTSVAKFSPNGFWVASGDISGKVRVWSWDNPEHILKIETQVFAGEVKDLEWDSESKRLVAVGESQERNAKVFMWDTGNSLGELTGHGKRVLSVAYRPTRPFKLITASEDTRTVFYNGPPFVLDHSNTEHSNWVNCVRYSPDGNTIITVGSDKKIVFYDGKTGQYAGTELVDAHGGSIYSVSFSPDGTKFVTSSADKTVKIWNLATKALEATVAFDDSQVADMQNGVLWVPSGIVSVSLNGDVNLIDPANPTAPPQRLQGHQVTVTALAMLPEAGLFFTASYDGMVMQWDRAGRGTRLGGVVPRTVNLANHGGKVTGAAVSGGDKLRTVGFDDKLRTATISTHTYDQPELSLPGQPISIANGSPSSDLMVVIYRPQGVVAYRGSSVVAEQPSLPFVPSALSVLGEDEVAIGGEDNKVYIFDISSGAFTLQHTVTGPRGQISALAYNPSGDLLAVGDSNREVSVFERGAWTARVQNSWVYHTSRITALAWNPSGELLASGSSDCHIFLWSVSDPQRRIQLELAHKDGVTVLGWLSETELVSSGNDACVVQWDVSKAPRK